MKKQVLAIAAVLLLVIAVSVFLAATPVHNQRTASPKCSKTCQSKPAATPQTGFFIFDSFPGNL